MNDVVLATSALALGRHLRRSGECHRWLRTLVPVSTRPQGAGAELGNRVSFVFVELPVGERSPCDALDEVARQMREHKRAGGAGALDDALRAARFAPLPLRDALGWIATRPQTFNTVVSNIPGPREPLYLLGRPVRAAYPSVPLARGHGLVRRRAVLPRRVARRPLRRPRHRARRRRSRAGRRILVRRAAVRARAEAAGGSAGADARTGARAGLAAGHGHNPLRPIASSAPPARAATPLSASCPAYRSRPSAVAIHRSRREPAKRRTAINTASGATNSAL